MNKTLMALTLISVFMAGAAQADDHSATVSINGSITGDNTGCSVLTSKDSLTLSGQLADLPTQGGNAIAPASLTYSIVSEGESCIDKIALVLHGEADNADGTTLANTDTSPESAKGIGIGVFDSNFSPITINNNKINPMTDIHTIYLQAVRLNGQVPVEGTLHSSLTIDIVRL